jgi:HSP20 family protein
MEVIMSSLIRYESPVATLPSLIDELFNDSFFGWRDREITSRQWPRVDIVEEDNAFTLRADVPGVDKNNIKVSVENGLLTISGEKKEERENKKGNYAYFERSYGSFSRSFNLPDHVDEKNIAAKYHDGVLELTLKKTEEAKAKAIEVKVE